MLPHNQAVQLGFGRRADGLNVDDDGEPVQEVVSNFTNRDAMVGTDLRGNVQTLNTEGTLRELLLHDVQNHMVFAGQVPYPEGGTKNQNFTITDALGEKRVIPAEDMDWNRVVFYPPERATDALANPETYIARYRDDNGELKAMVGEDGFGIGVTLDASANEVLSQTARRDKAQRTLDSLKSDMDMPQQTDELSFLSQDNMKRAPTPQLKRDIAEAEKRRDEEQKKLDALRF